VVVIGSLLGADCVFPVRKAVLGVRVSAAMPLLSATALPPDPLNHLASVVFGSLRGGAGAVPIVAAVRLPPTSAGFDLVAWPRMGAG
jgi:hypothetical protein